MTAIEVKRQSLHPYFTVRTLAEYLALSERTIRSMAADGTIPSYKMAGARRFSWDDVQRFEAKCRER